jgi:preprotein translocase subunit SecD
MDIIVANIKERLNVFGLSDIIVRTATDLSGAEYIIVEIAGANKEEVRNLLAQQGKFEAKVGNETVFRGGDNDITYVCRSPTCSGLDTRRGGCGQTSDGWACRFHFSIMLRPDAARRQAAITDQLAVRVDQGGSYLSQPLDLYLDDQLVDTLQIAADLKGKAVTEIEITGSGTGRTYQEAVESMQANMKKLQTVMITGSLPVQLDIVKTDAISPVLGKAFLQNAILVGVLAILTVCLVVYIRYRNLRISLPMIATMISEVILILGFAAVSGWNLDLAAIAAIIVSIGTGVDDQIVIADETFYTGKRAAVALSWKERLGRAFFIIIAAYIATLAAMVPLWFAGAGMLRGFAIVTIMGVSFGVLLARPAYAAVLQILLEEKDAE